MNPAQSCPVLPSPSGLMSSSTNKECCKYTVGLITYLELSARGRRGHLGRIGTVLEGSGRGGVGGIGGRVGRPSTRVVEGCRGWKVVARRAENRRLRNTISVYLSAKRSCHHPYQYWHGTPDHRVVPTSRQLSFFGNRLDRISVVGVARRHLRSFVHPLERTQFARPRSIAISRRSTSDLSPGKVDAQGWSSKGHSLFKGECSAVSLEWKSAEVLEGKQECPSMMCVLKFRRIDVNSIWGSWPVKVAEDRGFVFEDLLLTADHGTLFKEMITDGH
ncbi:uncharacterized protein LOC143183507 [Calliopsis andreniformis]|uniref:uncharacterized protein LOC143183507 n=1 Tax=Calliopsis andreniformis TaxID=337506 RepID=UPI003FCDCF7B